MRAVAGHESLILELAPAGSSTSSASRRLGCAASPRPRAPRGTRRGPTWDRQRAEARDQHSRADAAAGGSVTWPQDARQPCGLVRLVLIRSAWGACPRGDLGGAVVPAAARPGATRGVDRLGAPRTQ